LHAAKALEERVNEALEGTSRIDRVSFRVKLPSSFAKKCVDTELGTPRYGSPLEEVEDQITGRILVFFRDDLETVEKKIRAEFSAAVEVQRTRPDGHSSFGYESDHYIFVIDEHMKPAGWLEAGPMPTTFELQIRTLFMHAFAEPQHDIGYKADKLDLETHRQFAWIAASAWGADQTMNDLQRRLEGSQPEFP
jgi:ppGpp synthetase/RelA/SpoT-type nucleotidyltranferase